MELVKPESRNRIVFPFPEIDPEFSVELRKLTDMEAVRIRDKHHFGFGKETSEKALKVIRDTVDQSVVRVNGATQNGVTLEPTARETKLLLLDIPVEVGGEKVSLWSHVIELAAEQEAAESKNSLRV